MQTSTPLAPSGPCTGIILEGSTAGLGQPVGYIAILVSGPQQKPPSIQTMPQPVCQQTSQLPPLQTKQQQGQSRKAGGLTEPLRKAVGGLGAAQIVTGLASITAESISYESTREYGQISYKGALAGIWCGALFFVTGVIAAHAAKSQRFGLIITTMVMSIISATFFTFHLSFTAAFINPNGEWTSLPQVVRALEMALSVLELIFSIACSACCCRAVCRRNCCFCCVDFTTYQNHSP